MNIQIDIENLKETYLISNTASFLYNSYSKDESILELKKIYSQQELIKKFEDITKSEINTIDELVLAYAIYISILQYDNETTFEFLNVIGNINFEWFPELKHLYLSRFKAFNFSTMKVKDFHSRPNKVSHKSNIEINNQLIEFA